MLWVSPTISSDYFLKKPLNKKKIKKSGEISQPSNVSHKWIICSASEQFVQLCK